MVLCSKIWNKWSRMYVHLFGNCFWSLTESSFFTILAHWLRLDCDIAVQMKRFHLITLLDLCCWMINRTQYIIGYPGKPGSKRLSALYSRGTCHTWSHLLPFHGTKPPQAAPFLRCPCWNTAVFGTKAIYSSFQAKKGSVLSEALTSKHILIVTSLSRANKWPT